MRLLMQLYLVSAVSCLTHSQQASSSAWPSPTAPLLTAAALLLAVLVLAWWGPALNNGIAGILAVTGCTRQPLSLATVLRQLQLLSQKQAAASTHSNDPLVSSGDTATRTSCPQLQVQQPHQLPAMQQDMSDAAAAPAAVPYDIQPVDWLLQAVHSAMSAAAAHSAVSPAQLSLAGCTDSTAAATSSQHLLVHAGPAGPGSTASAASLRPYGSISLQSAAAAGSSMEQVLYRPLVYGRMVGIKVGAG